MNHRSCSLWLTVILIITVLAVWGCALSAPEDDDSTEDNASGGDCSNACDLLYNDCGGEVYYQGSPVSEEDCVSGCDQLEMGDCAATCINSVSSCGLFTDCTNSCLSGNGPITDDDDDDDYSDDDGASNSPNIDYAYWDPDYFEWSPSCEGDACSFLNWGICDLDNNIWPDGVICIYRAGTTDSCFGEYACNSVDFYGVDSNYDFTDCQDPIQFWLGILVYESEFSGGSGEYYVSCDIKVVDSDGNSDMITDVNLQVYYSGK
jgi:hypothetical protein